MSDLFEPVNTDSPNYGVGLISIVWPLVGSATLLVCARLYSKIFKLKRFALDDGLMLVCWVAAIITAISLQIAYHKGFGRHVTDLSPLEVYRITIWLLVAQAFIIVGPIFGRVSVCFYMLAILGKARKIGLRAPLWAFIVLQFILNIALVATLYATCGTNLIVVLTPATTCYAPDPTMRMALAVGTFNACTDAFLATLPTVLVMRLRTTLKTKLAVVALLSLSCFAFGAAVWRTSEVPALFSRNTDFTWTNVPYFAAAALEISVIIIAGSIPTLGPIFKKTRRSTASQGSMHTSAKRLSGDSGEITYNIGHALGMRMPQLGNSVTISAGPAAMSSSEVEILPMYPRKPSTALQVKATRKTDVSVEYINPDDHTDRWGPIHSRPRDCYDPTSSMI